MATLSDDFKLATMAMKTKLFLTVLWFFIFTSVKRSNCPGFGDDLIYSSYFGTSVLSTWFDSDFALIQLNNGNPITGIDIAYAGWDRTTANPSSVALMHHAIGDLMKISLSNTARHSLALGRCC